MALSNNGSCGSGSIELYQGRRSGAPASTERAISSPISSPSNGTSLSEFYVGRAVGKGKVRECEDYSLRSQ